MPWLRHVARAPAARTTSTEAGGHKLPSEPRLLSSLQAARPSVYCSHSATRALGSGGATHTAPPSSRLRLVSNSCGIAFLGELIGLEAALLGLQRIQHVLHERGRRLLLQIT